MLSAENVIAIVENKQKNIILQVDQHKREEAEKNRGKLLPIIQTVRFCGRQQLPPRGHTDSGRIELDEPEENDGNFRSLLRYRANFGDNNLKEQLKTSSANVMYTSPTIQNEIIEIFGTSIQTHIRRSVSKCGFFPGLADETKDISKTEQFSLCVRYIDEDKMKLREDFLTFVPVHDVTGAALANVIQETLHSLNFDLSKMRGQGCDGAAVMRGQFRGVQARILESFPKAVYTHCVSHSLNLCLCDASKVKSIRNSFGTLIETCNFFHFSSKRNEALRRKITELKPTAGGWKLKTLCETRWVQRHEAVFVFKEFLEPVVATVEDI